MLGAMACPVSSPAAGHGVGADRHPSPRGAPTGISELREARRSVGLAPLRPRKALTDDLLDRKPQLGPIFAHTIPIGLHDDRLGAPSAIVQVLPDCPQQIGLRRAR